MQPVQDRVLTGVQRLALKLRFILAERADHASELLLEVGPAVRRESRYRPIDDLTDPAAVLTLNCEQRITACLDPFCFRVHVAPFAAEHRSGPAGRRWCSPQVAPLVIIRPGCWPHRTRTANFWTYLMKTESARVRC